MKNWIIKQLNILRSFKNNDDLFPGAILPSEEELADMPQLSELVATVAPVKWKELIVNNIPKYSVYSQNGSGSCFPANALVMNEDYSYVPISKIRIGDTVITHKGNKKKVTKLFKRKWQGKTTLLKIRGISEELEATEEHPIFAIKGEQRERGKPHDKNPEFYKISELDKGDWVAIPIPTEVRDTTIYSFEKDPEFLWALGLYMAEGSIDKYCVCFSLHKDEMDFVERLKKTFSKYGSSVTFSLKTQSNGMQVKLQGEKWTKIFEELGGKLCQNKRISNRLMFIDPILQMKIVEGILDGDGSYTKDRIVLVSTSKRMIEQVKIILLRNGIYSFINKRKYRHDRKQVWTLEYTKSSYFSFVKDNYFFVQIFKKTTKKSFQGGHVYNIEVEDDNSYIVNSIAVHNCVAMSIALIATILYKIRTGIDIMFSASWVYRQRINQDSGMIGTDAFRIASNGLLPEVLMPSQDLTEGQINNVPVQSWFKKVAEVFALDDKFVQLPIKNIETVASVMQVTGKPVMVWFESTYSEWKTIPEISPNFINPFRHSVTAIDYGIYQGEKAIVIQESWGFKSTQLGAIRIIKESYFNKRNIFSAYPRRFKFDITNDRPVYDGTIISFQRCMKSIGLFPVGVDFIERFGPTTKRACEQFQVLHNLTVSGIIDSETESKLKTLFN